MFITCVWRPEDVQTVAARASATRQACSGFDNYDDAIGAALVNPGCTAVIDIAQMSPRLARQLVDCRGRCADPFRLHVVHELDGVAPGALRELAAAPQEILETFRSYHSLDEHLASENAVTQSATLPLLAAMGRGHPQLVDEVMIKLCVLGERPLSSDAFAAALGESSAFVARALRALGFESLSASGRSRARRTRRVRH